MPEVEPRGQRNPMTNGSGRNGLDLESLRRQYLENEDRSTDLWLLLNTDKLPSDHLHRPLHRPLF